MNALARRWRKSEGRTHLAVAVHMWRFWLTNLLREANNHHSEHEEKRGETSQHSLYRRLYDTVSPHYFL